VTVQRPVASPVKVELTTEQGYPAAALKLTPPLPKVPVALKLALPFTTRAFWLMDTVKSGWVALAILKL
jgi:hypothetical protein